MLRVGGLKIRLDPTGHGFLIAAQSTRQFAVGQFALGAELFDGVGAALGTGGRQVGGWLAAARRRPSNRLCRCAGS